MENLTNVYVIKLREGGLKRIKNVAGNVLLRPNDNISFMGKDRFEALKTALEIVLEDFKNHAVYKYYYTIDREKHGFSSFDRWNSWYNIAQ